MKLRPIGTYALAMTAILTSVALNYAQIAGRAQSSSASHVAAEVIKGRLHSADSKPGDNVVVKLNEDVKSNGKVILKKGTTITGVVSNVKGAPLTSAAKDEVKGQAQSIMEIEWLVPAAQGKAAQNLSIVLQSVTQVNPIYQHEQESAADNFGLAGSSAVSAAVARPAPSGSSAGSGSLFNSTAGGVVGTTAGVSNNAVGTVDSVGSTTGVVASSSSTRASGQSNPALLSMPSVVAVDQATSWMIESSLGTSHSGQLFKVGHGRLVTASGSQQSVDIFSHLNNDTVITSANKDFEISNGAQMQLLVGVNKR